MTRSALHDEAHVTNFLRLKRKVVESCGNDPSTIETLATNDEPFRKLCLELSSVAQSLSLSEASASGGIIAPVNQSFIQEWRDYEERLSAPLAGVFLADLGLNFDGAEKASPKEISDDWAQQEASSLEALIQYLDALAVNVDDEQFQTLLDDGVMAWRKLVTGGGLDLRGVFRRIDMAPLMLMPRHVAKKYGPDEDRSLYLKWSDARKAFVFGALRASIAMVLATLEQILHDVYGLSTTDLKEAIKKLPEYTSPHLVAKAQRIRTVAVWLLHAEQKAHKNKTELETLQEKKILNEALSNLEREVASALLVLRDLVEGARDDAMLVIQEVKSEDNGTYSERT